MSPPGKVSQKKESCSKKVHLELYIENSSTVDTRHCSSLTHTCYLTSGSNLLPLHMKFKATLSNDSAVVLCGIITSLSKISTNTVVLLNETLIRFAGLIESVESPRLFHEYNVKSLFSEYRIESQSSNSILFEYSLDHFAKALVSSKSAPIVIIKLVKRGMSPCLCLEVKSLEGMSVDVIHDIPIKILRVIDIVHYMPPEVPSPKVALDLPKSKLIRSIVDRMSRFSKTIDLSFYQSGRMDFSIENGAVRTFCTGLQPHFSGDLNPEHDSDNFATLKLDSKKLMNILQLNSIDHSRATLYVAETTALVLHVIFQPADLGSITLYAPVLASSLDEDFFADGHD